MLSERSWPLRISLTYVGLGIVWILLSDRVLLGLGLSPQQITQLQGLKGTAFVLLSGLLVFELTRRFQAAQERGRRELVRSEQMYRTLARDLPKGAVFLFDHDLRFLLAEGQGLAEAGLRREGLEGRTLFEAVPASAPYLEPLYRAALAGETRTDVRQYNGIHYKVVVQPVRDTQGRIWAGLAVGYDVSEMVEAQQVLRERAELEGNFRRLFEENPLPMWVYDRESYRFLEVNRAALETYGYSREEFLGMTILDIRPPEEVGRLQANLSQPRQEHENSGPWRHRLKDGREIWVEIISHVHTFAGRPAVLVAAKDVTHQVESQRALQASERRFRALVENAPDAISLLDPQGNIVFDTPASTRILGYSQEERRGQNAFELVHPEDLAATREVFGQVLERPGGLGSAVMRFRHKDGSWRWLEAIASNLLLEPSVGGVVVNFRDVTERKQAEEAVLALNARLEQRVGELEALQKIDQAILNREGIADIAALILRETLEHLEVDAAALYRFDAPWGALEYVGGMGFRGTGLGLRQVRLGEGLLGRVAQRLEPLELPDLWGSGAGSPRAEAFREEGLVGYAAVPVLAGGRLQGVLEAFRRTPLHLSAGDRAFLKALANQAGVALAHAELLAGLEKANAELHSAYDHTIEALAAAIDLRDHETENHSRRVTELTLELARRMGMGPEELRQVRRGALLHDVGKLAVPDAVLLKPGKLTEEEWAEMKKHPVHAYEWLSQIPFLAPALEIPYAHHERWDGSGYPRGLKGEEIPLAARIFAVIDVYDALTSDRPYRAAWSQEKTLRHLREQAGTHFDPAVVEAFLGMIAHQRGGTG
ncbi:PAS domain S-box protein [Calidithermus chliarophilus]|uniref:PAS domain S-box protein n=1 Tax=Calidithermus chliarophilus TaxID=52023 RepID=UPI000A06D1C4|nr:PAS domain S-box protein [Calidithermus chliarophilus]